MKKFPKYFRNEPLTKSRKKSLKEVRKGFLDKYIWMIPWKNFQKNSGRNPWCNSMKIPKEPLKNSLNEFRWKSFKKVLERITKKNSLGIHEIILDEIFNLRRNPGEIPWRYPKRITEIIAQEISGGIPEKMLEGILEEIPKIIQED